MEESSYAFLLRYYLCSVQKSAHAGLCGFAVVDELGFYGLEGCYGEEGFCGSGAETCYYVSGTGDVAFGVGEEGFVGVEGDEAWGCVSLDGNAVDCS